MHHWTGLVLNCTYIAMCSYCGPRMLWLVILNTAGHKERKKRLAMSNFLLGQARKNCTYFYWKGAYTCQRVCFPFVIEILYYYSTSINTRINLNCFYSVIFLYSFLHLKLCFCYTDIVAFLDAYLLVMAPLGLLSSMIVLPLLPTFSRVAKVFKLTTPRPLIT